MPKIQVLSQTDVRSWNAINVAQAVISAQIIGAYIHDVTTDTGYVESDESNRHPFPVDIPYGHVIYSNISTRNTGDVTLNMRVTIELYDPDGILRASKIGSIYTVNPGIALTSPQIPNTMLDKVGTWVLHGILEAELA
jgi:hypothetical protein